LIYDYSGFTGFDAHDPIVPPEIRIESRQR